MGTCEHDKYEGDCNICKAEIEALKYKTLCPNCRYRSNCALDTGKVTTCDYFKLDVAFIRDA